MTIRSELSDKYPPTFNRSVDDYSRWKKKLVLWQSITEVTKKRQGGMVVLSLDEETQEQVLEYFSATELAVKSGIKKVISYLDSLFEKDKTAAEYEIFKQFDEYIRPHSVSMKDFSDEFEKRWNKTSKTGTNFSQSVLGCILLKAANLSEYEERLVKATVKEISYNEVKNQLRKMSNDINSYERKSFKFEDTVTLQMDYGSRYNSESFLSDSYSSAVLDQQFCK